MTTVAGTVWPVATRERIVEIWKPDATSSEAPFRTLRRRGWTSAGSVVHRHDNGRLRGSVALFSSLNLDAASCARRGEGGLAEHLAEQAGVVEQTRTFQRLLAHLATVEPSVLPGVVAGVEPVVDERARALLAELAEQTEGIRDGLVGEAERGGVAYSRESTAKVGCIVESTPHLVFIAFALPAGGDAREPDRTAIPRSFARAVNREMPGDFLALLSQQGAPDRIDIKVLPALGLAADGPRPFSPFNRNDPRLTRISDEEADRLRGEPAPLRVIVPVVVEE